MSTQPSGHRSSGFLTWAVENVNCSHPRVRVGNYFLCFSSGSFPWPRYSLHMHMLTSDCRLWWDFPAHSSVILCPAHFSYLYPPGLSTLFLQLRVTTGLCLGFSSLSFFLETLFKQETQAIADFPYLFMLSQASASYIPCC